MYHIEFDQTHRLLKLAYSGTVDLAETKRCRADVEALLPAVGPGFTLLTDLSGLDQMDFACIDEVRAMMDRFREHGVAHVVRVIPDWRKDIGFTILSYFHYGRNVTVQTVDTLAEGLKAASA
jgi:anti-anti-sigma regulatory factor